MTVERRLVLFCLLLCKLVCRWAKEWLELSMALDTVKPRIENLE